MSAIEIPLRIESEANMRGMHWAAKARRTKAARSTTCLVLRSKGPRVALPVVVELVRVAPRALDDDNLRGALKAVRDGVADWLGVDDRDARVEWRYAQARGAAKTYAVRVVVSERKAAA